MSGVKSFKRFLQHLHSSDNFKILLSFSRYIKLHFKHKKEKSILLPIFAIWKVLRTLKMINKLSLHLNKVFLVSHYMTQWKTYVLSFFSLRISKITKSTVCLLLYWCVILLVLQTITLQKNGSKKSDQF